MTRSIAPYRPQLFGPNQTGEMIGVLLPTIDPALRAHIDLTLWLGLNLSVYRRIVPSINSAVRS